MLQQAEILEDDADAAPQRRDVAAADRGGILVEDAHAAPRRAERQEQEAEQRRLARAGGAGDELERARRDVKRHVAQDFRPEPVAKADIFEADHVMSLNRPPSKYAPALSRR